MLRLLLCLSALGLVSDAVSVSVTGPGSIDLSTCPITFLGKSYSSASVQFSSTNEPQILFDDLNAYVSLPVVGFTVFSYEILDAAAVASYAVAAAAEAQITNLVPPAQCGAKLTFPLQSGMIDVYFLSYGLQAAVHYTGRVQPGDVFNIAHNGAFVSSLSVTSQVSGQFDESVDVTGCLDDTTGTTYLSGDSETDPAACTRRTCQSTGVMGPQESACSSSQVCLGNNECIERSFCSIVGPSVVDFNGATGAVPDFCIYTILNSDNRLSVKGIFGERHLTDVPFLSEVFMTTSSGSIHMDTGSRVYVDNNDVTSNLSSTATRHGGADISKDDSGVTVTYTDANLTRITLFFDGTLLHVTQEVPTGSRPYDKGLCVNATADSKYAALSGCDEVTVDAAGENIDCSAVQTRCSDLLATLSSAVDRSAFVTACADNLLCHYPDVDGLACHFLDAYARTSHLSVPREASGCAAPVCVDHHCSWHEFCGVKDSGDATCFCRSRDQDLQKYREMNQYGDVATCSGDSASLTIYTCLLEEAGFDYSELRLKDSSCTGSYDAVEHSLTFGFNSSHPCGGTLQHHGDQVVFANRVQNMNNSIITFRKQFSMDFSCAYTQPSTPSTASFRIHDGYVSLMYDTENFTFTLNMGLFTDAAFSSSSTVINSTVLELNQEVFVRLDAHDIGAGALALVIDDCWTTTEATATGANRYDLISNKCPSDQSVTVPSNGEALVSYFKFNVFKYTDAPTHDIYLHCQVSLCIVGVDCVPTCPQNDGE